MKKLNFVILFLLLFHFTLSEINAAAPHVELVSEADHNYLEMSAKKAVGTRRLSEIDRLSKARGTLEEEQLAKEITLNAFDYTTGETHEDSIKKFIKINFGIDSTKIYCVAPERINKREFVFIDKEHGIVVKVFPQIPKKAFKIIHELSGHSAFEAINVCQGKLASFLALGKYTYNNTEFLLLAMTYVDGKEIRKYIYEIFAALDQAARQAAIDRARHILMRLGQVIGEIHLAAAVKAAPSMEHKQAVINYYTTAIHKAIEKCHNEDGISNEELISYFNHLLDEYDLAGVHFSIYHGDAHLANFLYDNETDQIAIVDSVRAHLSIDPARFPISDYYVHDSVKIKESIVKQILSFENNFPLIQELIEAFQQGYDERAHTILNPASLKLEQSYNILKKFASSSKWKEETDLKKREIEWRINEYYEKRLKEALDDSLNFDNPIAELVTAVL